MREKRKANAEEAESQRKKRRCEEKQSRSFRQEVEESEAMIPCPATSFREEVEEPTEAAISFPTTGDLLRATPLEGIGMEELLAKFWRPERASSWDRERFCSMLHEIGTVDTSTRKFTLTLVEED